MADLEQLARALAGAGHTTRLRLLVLLQEGEISPRRATNRLGDLPLGNVAHHFRQLRAAGLVFQSRSRPVRGATEHFYALTATAWDLIDRLDLDGDRITTRRRLA